MAKGFWRNWTEMFCECGYRAYKKYLKKIKGKYICKKCNKELKERES